MVNFIEKEPEKQSRTEKIMLEMMDNKEHEHKSNEQAPIVVPEPEPVTEPATTTTELTTSTRVNPNKAFWSEWSEWSPCRSTNRACDPGRIHSRIRKCLNDNGEVVNIDRCRVDSLEQQELEIRACRCGEQTEQTHQNNPKINMIKNSTGYLSSTVAPQEKSKH